MCNIVSPFSSTSKIFTLKDDYNFSSAVATGGKVKATLTSATSSSAVINLDTVKGIQSKMAVQGTGVVVDPTYDFLRVESIDYANNRITVSSTQSIDDATKLTFLWPENIPTHANYDVDKGYNLISVRNISPSLDDGKLKIEGYIDVSSIAATNSGIDIFIDDFVNIN